MAVSFTLTGRRATRGRRRRRIPGAIARTSGARARTSGTRARTSGTRARNAWVSSCIRWARLILIRARGFNHSVHDRLQRRKIGHVDFAGVARDRRELRLTGVRTDANGVQSDALGAKLSRWYTRRNVANVISSVGNQNGNSRKARSGGYMT